MNENFYMGDWEVKSIAPGMHPRPLYELRLADHLSLAFSDDPKRLWELAKKISDVVAPFCKEESAKLSERNA